MISYAREVNGDLCIIAEPARCSDHPDWIISGNRLSAIFCSNPDLLVTIKQFKSGEHFAAVRCGDFYVISCYVSPNSDRNYYLGFLEDLESALLGIANRCILAGDFNAHSVLWGSRLNSVKGDLLREWIACRDLRLMNYGNIPTCVRPQGSSCVDLTWISADLVGRTLDWMVLEDRETIRPSDDQLPGGDGLRSWSGSIPTSSLKVESKKDGLSFHSHLDWTCEFGPSEADLDSANGPATWLDDTMRAACEYFTPRSGHKLRRRVFWWNEDLTDLRASCERAKKHWHRLRKRRYLLSEDAGQSYWLARNSLRFAIKRAKSVAWRELIASIDHDPWGLPYKLVLKRLRRSLPGLTEVLDDAVLRRLLDSLFPPGNP